MQLNKPKYTLFKNTKYALSGFLDIIKNESSFKLQIIFFVLLSICIALLSVELKTKAILFISLFLPILAEIVNSAIERVVDLVTLEYHDLAKRAKDVGATLVFVSIIVTVIIWVLTIYITIQK